MMFDRSDDVWRLEPLEPTPILRPGAGGYAHYLGLLRMRKGDRVEKVAHGTRSRPSAGAFVLLRVRPLPEWPIIDSLRHYAAHRPTGSSAPAIEASSYVLAVILGHLALLPVLARVVAAVLRGIADPAMLNEIAPAEPDGNASPPPPPPSRPRRSRARLEPHLPLVVRGHRRERSAAAALAALHRARTDAPERLGQSGRRRAPHPG
jgi:hypothetical protein